ncbi:CHASE2 domain-containing protein [Fortiea contorta]|uniref:sensor histidine kinase n=1 Tax=Fortiea contorta TaxID=1892405 RepID=UPI00034C1D63|nr:CHASE2 domain-containing protein [Fortiea contorta]
MSRRIWNRIRKELRLWSVAAPPGIMILLLVVFIRLVGGMQSWEWMLLDTMLRLRPIESVDERVVIVGIDEEDIALAKQYPVPDQKIAELLTKLETYQPLAIGLDIFKNVPVEPGGAQLAQVLQNNSHIIGIEKLFRPEPVPPPQSLPKERVGFVDIINDEDSKNRRYLLFTSNPQNINEDKYSLALRLVMQYLQAKKIELETGTNDGNTIMIRGREFPRINSTFGAYTGINDKGLSILINFRNTAQAFRVVKMRDVMNNNVDPKLLRDRIILLGNRIMSASDIFYTSALPNLKLSGQIYGIDYHAHVVSQILSHVEDNRPMLHSWSNIAEDIWIFVWGFLPIVIGRLTQSVWQNLLGVGVAGVCLFGCGYLLLWVWGVWIPVAPSLLVLAANGVGLSAFAFYQHDKFLRSQIQERQNTIKYAFDVIHNGPLQTLAYGLKHMRAQDIAYEQLLKQFEKLDLEIREVGDFLRRDALSTEESLRIGSGLILELNRPLHDLLYEVYSSTLERKDFENFKTIRVKTRNFEPIHDKYLSKEDKRGICLFLEEALCNVGKHAHGAKRVEASGIYGANIYKLCVKDNGLGITSNVENKGTKHSKSLAKQLKGEFRREALVPRGTICELSWKPKQELWF